MSVPAVRLKPQLTLDRLLEGIVDAPAIPVTGIASDSRRLEPGCLFLACHGATSHGLDYLPQALAAGVSAVLWDSDTAGDAPPGGDVLMLPVAGLGRHLGEIANRWFDAPSQHMRVAGVTGTNGKTTVALLIAQSMQWLDRRCAYLGTLGAGIGKVDRESGMTTPACIELHEQLAEFRSQGAGYAALEVSSHALHQNRIDGVCFDAAIFTNLSRDHIDYHGDMQAYFDTKARLFLEHDIEHRIVNIDDESGARLAARCGDAVAVSMEPGRNANGAPGKRSVFVNRIDAQAHGSSVTVDTSWGSGTFHLPLVGKFNVANAALVLAQLLCWRVPFAEAARALGNVTAPAGRMQRVRLDRGSEAPAVYVDYAHTPAGLEAVLESLRDHCTGNLWCVFGCGGDRDRGKRPLMGAVVSRLADRAVVTSDNPRFEPPADIIAEVLGGMDKRAVAIPDREAAIAWAINEARDNDIVLIAGKGHENVQIVGNARLPFSDIETAREKLAARLAAGGFGR